MSLSNAAENALLNLIFRNTAWANIGDAAGLQPSGSDGSFYVSLHTADPGEAGTQSTSETAYIGYARVAVPRNNAGFNPATTGEITNTDTVVFPLCTGSSSVITHFGIGTSETGAGNLILSGALNAPLSVSNGIQPTFQAGDLRITAD